MTSPLRFFISHVFEPVIDLTDFVKDCDKNEKRILLSCQRQTSHMRQRVSLCMIYPDSLMGRAFFANRICQGPWQIPDFLPKTLSRLGQDFRLSHSLHVFCLPNKHKRIGIGQNSLPNPDSSTKYPRISRRKWQHAPLHQDAQSLCTFPPK